MNRIKFTLARWRPGEDDISCEERCVVYVQLTKEDVAEFKRRRAQGFELTHLPVEVTFDE
jgi:hypothetical protein